jgi:hypothetical protein
MTGSDLTTYEPFWRKTMSHAMMADLIFSLSVVYLLILDKIDLCKLHARVDALEKKLAIKSKQSQESDS